MTVGELIAVVSFANEREKALIERKEKYIETLSAANAYNTAVLCRARDIPSSFKEAFPTLFGLNEDGAIDDWRVLKQRMNEIARAHNASFKGGD